MSIFSLFTLLGGLAFFLFGMNVMSTSLEKMSGGKLEKTLKQLTSTPIKSLMFGAIITAVIQSSSALTVMLVGLVNSGIMSLSQTVGVLMGSNIGTTITAWLLSMVSIESDNIIMLFLKPDNFAPLMSFVGIVLIMAGKKESKKDTGKIMIGFGLLMQGMNMMGDAVAPLAEIPEFTQILTMFNNPVLGVIVGMLFTALIQSSSASVGILQALSLTGGISFRMAIPIIMGQNIGTCITALISSIGVNKNAKRVSVVHIAFNVIGTMVGLVLFFGLDLFLHFTFLDFAIDPVMIAICHSAFNIFTTIILLPFTKVLVKIAEFVIKSDDEEIVYELLDTRLLNSPSLALEESFQLTKKMMKIAQNSIEESIVLTKGYNEKSANQIKENEERLDLYEDKLDSFLVRLSGQDVVDSDAREIFKLLHGINDIERIGDHACNVLDLSKTMEEKNFVFSDEAVHEIEVLTSAVSEIVGMTIEAFSKNDLEKAKEIEPLEEVVDRLVSKMKKNHIKRLQKGICTVDLGYILSDVLNNYERVSDHCSNIALSIIEVELGDKFDSHEYIRDYRKMDNPHFKDKYEMYKAKYVL